MECSIFKTKAPARFRKFRHADGRTVLSKNGSELDLALNVALQLADGHTDLLHGVAVTDGDAVVGHDALGLVAHGVKVHGDAVQIGRASCRERV